jgi:hypothetical protein
MSQLVLGRSVENNLLASLLDRNLIAMCQVSKVKWLTQVDGL